MSWQLFTWVDWAIVGILGISTLLSLVRGFSREALSLGAWVLAWVVANMWAAQLSEQLTPYIENDTARFVAAFVLVFAAVIVTANIAIIMVGKAVKVAGLSTFDRVLGMVFGFARGLVVVLVILFIVRKLVPTQTQIVLDEAQLVPHLDMVMDWAQRTFPELGDSVPIPQLPV